MDGRKDNVVVVKERSKKGPSRERECEHVTETSASGDSGESDERRTENQDDLAEERSEQMKLTFGLCGPKGVF